MNKLPYYKAVSVTMSQTEKVGQLFMPAAFINDSEEEIRKLEKLIAAHHVGGLCFFHSRASAATNFEGKKKVIHNENSFDTLKKLILRYQSVSKFPLLIAIDAEWGLAMRIENTPQYPYAITLGAIQNSNNLVFEVGAAIAKDCRAAGIHWNLAPVVDINNNPNNPVIGYRSFGSDRKQVSQKAIALVKGMKSEGVLTSIKHFPGHGDTDTDSHLGLPLIGKSKQELLENELYPFQQLINEGVDSVMIGHLSVPALTKNDDTPASINKEIITGLLRNGMGYDGVVISDALNMHAVAKHYPRKGELEWLAFDAGNDVLCFAEHTKEGIATILKNAGENQINTSFDRIWKLKEEAFKNSSSSTNTILSLSTAVGFNSSSSDAKLDFSKCSALNRQLAEKSLTLVHGTEMAIAAFRETNFCTFTVKRYSGMEDSQDILNALETSKQEIADEQHILLLLTPPKVKPANTFGFLEEELVFINQLIKTKKVVLYHFGNPYALTLFTVEHTLATVVVYQDFKIFQEIATEHFLGKLKAVGKLPFNLAMQKQ